MWNNDLLSNQHQVIHPDSGPFPAAIFLHPAAVLSATDPQLSADFSTSIQKQPDRVAFFDPDCSCWNVCAVIKDEGD